MKTGEENTEQERARLIHDALNAYMDLFILMQAVTLSHWLSFELTFAQGKAAILLAAHKELTISQLAKLLGVGKSAASILVQQLVERGLVTRTEQESDRRRSVVRLSERGAEIASGRLKEREGKWQSWLSHLSDEELSALARGLNALRDVVQLESEGRPGTQQPALPEPESEAVSPEEPVNPGHLAK